MANVRTRRTADATVTRAHYYRTVCGLPCSPDGNSDRIVLRTGDVGAITLPEALAEFVHDRLVAAGTPAPVIGYPNDRWTILTRPHRLDGDTVLVARLNSVNAQLIPPGAIVLLPAPADDLTGRLRWIAKPRDMFRPAMTAVLTELAAVVRGGPLAGPGRDAAITDAGS